jgi:hypothetical protein
VFYEVLDYQWHTYGDGLKSSATSRIATSSMMSSGILTQLRGRGPVSPSPHVRDERSYFG